MAISGVSSNSKFVRDRLNLARNIIELERIAGVHGREGRSLAPPTVKQLPVGSNSIPITGFRVLGDLQQALGKM
jgi:hypothetical protein